MLSCNMLIFFAKLNTKFICIKTRERVGVSRSKFSIQKKILITIKMARNTILKLNKKQSRIIRPSPKTLLITESFFPSLTVVNELS